MATIVNNPVPTTDSSGSGFIIGSIVLVGLVIAFIYLGLPAMRNIGNAGSSTPVAEVIVPDQVKVTVNQPE